MGTLIGNDATMRRKQFKEMARLIGVRVTYQHPTSLEHTNHAEVADSSTFSSPVPMDIIFDENPKVGTLKKLSWVSEVGENYPIIAHLPYNTPNLQNRARINMGGDSSLRSCEPTRTFEITTISSIQIYPEAWTVKLVPVYEKDIPAGDYGEENYKFLKG